MSKDELYQKVVTPGGRVKYEVVARRWDRDLWPLGWHVVGVAPEGRTTCFGIDPDHAAILAALREARPALQAALGEALKGQPNPDTEIQAKALQAYRDAGGAPTGGWFSATAHDLLRVLEDAMLDLENEKKP